MTDPDDRIIDHSIRESPASEPHIFWEVVWPPLWFGFASYLLFRWLYWPAVGEGMAGAVMLVALGWRLWQFDRNGRGVHIVEHKTYREPEEPQREWAIATEDNGDGGNGGHRLRIGPWLFRESEIKRLRDALEDGTLTRAALDSVLKDNGQRFFTNTSDRYQEYVNTFRRIGWLDEDNRLTPVARDWFAGRGYPLPPNNV